MADIVSPGKRSSMMARIRAKNTGPEMVVRRAIFAEGLRYRLHRKDLPGAPDIVMPGRKVAIFVHGCFWHQHEGCRFASKPASNTDFWRHKLGANVDRDRRAVDALLALGWRVLTIWECTTRDKSRRAFLAKAILDWLDKGAERGVL